MNNTKTVQKFLKCAIAKELKEKVDLDFTHLDIEIVSCEKLFKEALSYKMIAGQVEIKATVYEWGEIELYNVKDSEGNTLYLVGGEYCFN